MTLGDFLKFCATSIEPTEWVGLLLTLLIGWSVYRAHMNESMKDFNLFDLVMENGRVSKVAFVFLATWGACTFAFLRHTSKVGLDLGILGAYGGLFVTPLIARFWSPVPVVPPKDQPPPVQP